MTLIEESVEDIVDEFANDGIPSSEWNWDGLILAFGSTFLANVDVPDSERGDIGRDALLEQLLAAARAQREAKAARLGADLTHQLERHVILRTIDELWKDHLHELDMLRSGIGLRAYGQRDPLLEYKHESFSLFEQMMQKARRETVTRFFRLEIAVAPRTEPVLAGGAARKAEASTTGVGGGAAAAGAFAQGQAVKPPVNAVAGATAAATAGTATGNQTVEREAPKVGRNDPCPCGSGKKFKKCHEGKLDELGASGSAPPPAAVQKIPPSA